MLGLARKAEARRKRRAERAEKKKLLGNVGDSTLRSGTPPPKGDGRSPGSSASAKRKPNGPPPPPLEVIVARLCDIGMFDEASAIVACCDYATKFTHEPNAEGIVHNVYVPRICTRAYCPICGVEGSASHMRKYSRLVNAMMGVRYQKDVVTFPAHQRPSSRGDMDAVSQALADLVAVWWDVPASFVVTHYLGERTQTVHFEVLTPDKGKPRSKDELRGFEDLVGWALSLDVTPIIQHSYISVDRLDADGQAGKWWHGTRYATHPTAYPGRWTNMSDEQLKEMLTAMSGRHSVRGYGLWSTSKVNSKEAKALAEQYPIDLGDKVGQSEIVGIAKVHDGGECPKCKAELVLERDANRRAVSCLVPFNTTEIQPGIWVSPDIVKGTGKEFREAA